MGLHLNILPGDEKIFVIIGVVLLIIALRIVSILATRQRGSGGTSGSSPRSYGLFGGAICPRCGHPFILGPASINLGLGTKFARCEACGRWSVVHRASVVELQEAEKAPLAEDKLTGNEAQDDEAEKKQKLLDDSRYME